MFVSNSVAGRWFSLGMPVSSTNKIYLDNINWNIVESVIIFFFTYITIYLVYKNIYIRFKFLCYFQCIFIYL
jgi:hypothetical protein